MIVMTLHQPALGQQPNATKTVQRESGIDQVPDSEGTPVVATGGRPNKAMRLSSDGSDNGLFPVANPAAAPPVLNVPVCTGAVVVNVVWLAPGKESDIR